MVETFHIAPNTDLSIAFTRWRLCVPQLIHGSLGPHQSAPPNSIQTGSGIFAGLTRVTNTQMETNRHVDHAMERHPGSLLMK